MGHSAGGWIARILLCGERYQGVRYARCSQVHTLVTLGTPHQSLERYPFGRVEVSRGGAGRSGGGGGGAGRDRDEGQQLGVAAC